MTQQDEPRSASGSTGISRRTLAKGAAWTTPVLLVGAVTPAQAASGPTNPCQCLVGYSVFGARSTWSLTGSNYSFGMRVVNAGCGLLSLFFSVANATDPSVSYAVTYSDGSTETLTGATTSGGLLVGGTISGTVTATSGKRIASFCATMDVRYTPLGGTASTCPLVLCWSLDNPAAASGYLAPS
ncbi:hypothetical protein ATK17_2291 [Branchiibius hedensis]|uniref:Tat (Twin-arginine translocation) pathway signal sequence n=1 Tax=Branchiibius hedensis TaxID=672460 RepID=A0A2Y8ZXG0_9MICO|nr:hypothetical protein [Branchiibius hedensis]PWJ26147.1 hypothetical protein ATK17_2291 [Branchiibius hedensis]SSA34959.1 hypothetical protein SAMN04489750_2291 [Branchiibius hedensis]